MVSVELIMAVVGVSLFAIIYIFVCLQFKLYPTLEEYRDIQTSCFGHTEDDAGSIINTYVCGRQ